MMKNCDVETNLLFIELKKFVFKIFFFSVGYKHIHKLLVVLLYVCHVKTEIQSTLALMVFK